MSDRCISAVMVPAQSRYGQVNMPPGSKVISIRRDGDRLTFSFECFSDIEPEHWKPYRWQALGLGQLIPPGAVYWGSYRGDHEDYFVYDVTKVEA